ncbi:pre-mRNA branch site protein p14 [Babesia caballi]|uniref:Pre-mRNA branch site protein p14 n=1 Tax=Babesia caballi TaxID=5871 RepID=A0AAV4LVY6_BABCB|nr:pre-mRNA branch site protein p14 [Babesia caballi]
MAGHMPSFKIPRQRSTAKARRLRCDSCRPATLLPPCRARGLPPRQPNRGHALALLGDLLLDRVVGDVSALERVRVCLDQPEEAVHHVADHHLVVAVNGHDEPRPVDVHLDVLRVHGAYARGVQAVGAHPQPEHQVGEGRLKEGLDAPPVQEHLARKAPRALVEAVFDRPTGSLPLVGVGHQAYVLLVFDEHVVVPGVGALPLPEEVACAQRSHLSRPLRHMDARVEVDLRWRLLLREPYEPRVGLRGLDSVYARPVTAGDPEAPHTLPQTAQFSAAPDVHLT